MKEIDQRFPTHLNTDYTVRALTDLVYFRIDRDLYQAARNATMFEKSHTAAEEVNK